MSSQQTLDNQKESLKKLFQDSSKEIYEWALSYTNSPERAKEILAKVLQDAARTPALCLSRKNYLLELCDSICKQTTPIEDILGPSARLTQSTAETSSQPVPDFKQNPELDFEQTAEQNESSYPSSDYSLENDPWLQALRQQRRLKKRTVSPAAPPVKPVEPVKVTKQEFSAEAAFEGSMQAESDFEELFEELHQPKMSVLAKIGVALCCLIIAVLLWVIAGLLMNLGVIPYFDLGYSWFNSFFWNIF